MIAVRISVATNARRNRIAWVMGCSPPRQTELAAASFRGRPANRSPCRPPTRGRSWVLHHLLCVVDLRVTVPPYVSRPGPRHACARQPALGRREAHVACREEVRTGGVRRKVRDRTLVAMTRFWQSRDDRWSGSRRGEPTTTAASRRSGSCSPPRAATAPASNARSRPSSGRSRSTARRSTSASRSSTTSTSCATSRRRARSSCEEVDEVPEGAVTVLSAHGSPPAVYDEAARRELELIDATCPLVTKVHVEARRFAEEGRTIVLIGHAGPRGGRGDERAGARAHRPGAGRRGRRSVRAPRRRAARLPDADDAVGRRDRRDRRGAPRRGIRSWRVRRARTSATPRRTGRTR